jgi:hypothetical protein
VTKPRQGRQIGKMSLLTELEILGAGFLQRWRAYGAVDAMDEVGGHDYFFNLITTKSKILFSIKNQKTI